MVYRSSRKLTAVVMPRVRCMVQLLRMVNSGQLDELSGIISTGKEASVYTGVLRWYVPFLEAIPALTTSANILLSAQV